MIHKAWCNIEDVPYWSSVEEVLYCFSRSSIKFGHTGQKIADFDPNWVFLDQLQFEFIDGFEMMHTAWCIIEEVPYCFSRSSVIFQGHAGQKIADFDPNLVFRTVAPVWIHWWLWNDAQSLTYIQQVPYCFSRSSIKFQGYRGQKIYDLNPILSEIARPVAAIKYLRFVLFYLKIEIKETEMLRWQYISADTINICA